MPGLEYTLNDLIKINLAKVFEVAFWEMMEQGAPSTERLFALYRYHLDLAVQCVAAGIDFHMKNQYRNAPELMLNLFSHGPIEKGLDASHGGMTYYNICVDAADLATVADSFASLQQRIEQEKRLNMGGLCGGAAGQFSVAGSSSASAAAEKGGALRARRHPGRRVGRSNCSGLYGARGAAPYPGWLPDDSRIFLLGKYHYAGGERRRDA